jgi:16S rRNA (guanine527-N7)-methyltransferase
MNRPSWPSLLAQIAVSDSIIPKLNSFIDLFDRWNRRINLSAASTRTEVEEHLEDSLHVVPHLRGRSRVLDVGSGGGFPVVVAAACLPHVSFTALEPVHKKHAFLRTAARELALANLTPLAERLEVHARRDYDAAMSRATLDLRTWLALGRTYVVKDGIVVGFEAIPRDDLPATVERTRYELARKPRAIVVARD